MCLEGWPRAWERSEWSSEGRTDKIWAWSNIKDEEKREKQSREHTVHVCLLHSLPLGSRAETLCDMEALPSCPTCFSNAPYPQDSFFIQNLMWGTQVKVELLWLKEALVKGGGWSASSVVPSGPVVSTFPHPPKNQKTPRAPGTHFVKRGLEPSYT